MSRTMRGVLREAKRDGLTAELAWQTIEENTLQTAKRDKWRRSETAAAIASHFHELQAVYGVKATEAIRARLSVPPAPRAGMSARVLQFFKRGKRATD